MTPTDPTAIADGLRLILEPGQVTELRVLDAVTAADRRPHIESGYFDDVDKLTAATAGIHAKGFYFVLNPVNPALRSRAENRRRPVFKEPTTADHDVIGRRWLPVDCDAVRPSGISSTNAEHGAAIERCRAIYTHLKARGWPDPVAADSGNGGHLLYRVDLPTDDGGLIERCLAALAQRFNDGAVTVDTTVFNPARIWKLYGTRVCKGDDTADRPHRLAKILSHPADLRPVPRELLEALAAEAPPPAPAAKSNGHGTGASFDLAGWIAAHGLQVRGPEPWQGTGRRWVFDVCPWNPDHTNGSAFILQMPSGAPAAGCHHDGCKGRNWHALRDLVEPGWNRPRPAATGSPPSAPATPSKPKAHEPAQAEQLVRLALERYRIGQTEAGEPFAVARAGANLALMFRGSSDALRSVLAREYRRANGTTPNASALADAMTALQGEALEAKPEPVALRVAAYGAGVVIDLGDTTGSAVAVTAAGWEVLTPSPVLFRRTALTGALPVPVRGGNLADLRGLLNVTDENWQLVRGYLAAALLVIPHPILLLGGEQGTGKTTAARYLVGLVDPSPAPLRSEPRDAEAWALAAAGSWAVAIDNLSHIPGWFSDALCKAVSGDGWIRRRLYADSDLSVLSFRRVVLLTSIDAGALRGDLGDRLLLVDLERIPDANRRTEAELDAAYAQVQPALFGALLDLLAGVLRRLPTIKLPAPPRMADFACVLAAVETADGSDGVEPRPTFPTALDLYLAQRGRIAGDIIDGDGVASAVVRLVDAGGGCWTGTAGDLLARLTPAPPDRPPRGWPESARAMAGRLRRLIPALRGVGVEVTAERASSRERTRIYRLAREGAQSTVQTVRPSENPPGAAVDGGNVWTVSDSCGRLPYPDRPTPDPTPADVSDGSDGSDGISREPSDDGECCSDWPDPAGGEA